MVEPGKPVTHRCTVLEVHIAEPSTKLGRTMWCEELMMSKTVYYLAVASLLIPEVGAYACSDTPHLYRYIFTLAETLSSLRKSTAGLDIPAPTMVQALEEVRCALMGESMPIFKLWGHRMTHLSLSLVPCQLTFCSTSWSRVHAGPGSSRCESVKRYAECFEMITVLAEP